MTQKAPGLREAVGDTDRQHAARIDERDLRAQITGETMTAAARHAADEILAGRGASLTPWAREQGALWLARQRRTSTTRSR